MEVTYEDDAVLALTNGSYYIHDSSVTRFDIYYKDYRLFIDVYFDSGDFKRKSEKHLLKIQFSETIRYQFSWNNLYNFYTVESYKFLKTEQGYYLSLAPAEESMDISEDDEDLILGKKVVGFLIER